MRCTCGPGAHHPSCPLRKPTRPMKVRKVGRWWLWYCQHPACLDHAVHGLALPGVAADHGRAHLRLWHEDPTLPLAS